MGTAGNRQSSPTDSSSQLGPFPEFRCLLELYSSSRLADGARSDAWREPGGQGLRTTGGCKQVAPSSLVGNEATVETPARGLRPDEWVGGGLQCAEGFVPTDYSRVALPAGRGVARGARRCHGSAFSRTVRRVPRTRASLSRTCRRRPQGAGGAFPCKDVDPAPTN